MTYGRRSGRATKRRKVLQFSDSSSSDSEEEWLPGMNEDISKGNGP